MKILVLGGGGREHALAWRLARDHGVSRVFCAPGNAGTTSVAENVPLDPANPRDVLAFVDDHAIDLTVVGPELPLTRGVSDLLAAEQHLVFGPSRAAAEIESSKVFAKQFMQRHRIPTPSCVVCENADQARAAITSGRYGFPVVLKADGLAAGKGVIIAQDRDEAVRAVESVMVARQFGEAGDRLLVEEHVQGPEVSVFVIADGTLAVPFYSAQDHKRALDGDRGPNTGGMGALAPSALIDERMARRITDEVVAPTIAGMRAEGRPFCGFLYAGLMLTADGPKVLEFNARLGDPEAQVVLPMLADDLFPVLRDAARGAVGRASLAFRPGAAVGVVLASGGYPGRYQVGAPISGLDRFIAADDIILFHAGTAVRDDQVITAGGRVLTVVGRGEDYAGAIRRAYDGVARVSFDQMEYRRDIGAKALRTEDAR